MFSPTKNLLLPLARGACLIGVGVLLTTLAAVPLASQERGAQPATGEVDSGVYFEAVDVTVVNIDVHVRDKKGNRITDLTKEDFELFEDGRRVEITNFYTVEGRRARVGSRSSSVPLEGVSAKERVGLPLIDLEPKDQQLYLIIYFDNLFIRPFNRNKLVKEVNRFLFDHLARGDQAMLATFDRSLNIRQPFTSDRNAVHEALKGIEKLTGYGVQARTSRRDVVRLIDSSRDSLEALSHVDFYAKSLHHDLTQSIRALSEIVSSLGGLPGRKAILYVSDGVPMTPAEDLFFLVDEKFQGQTSSGLRAAEYRSKRRFMELTSKANANRITFYTLEAAGLRSHESLSAEYGQRSESLVTVDFMRDANRQQPLMLMADQTGGLATIGTNNFDDAFDEIGSDLDTYYSLGYTPQHSVAGRYHDVEVRVKRPGLTVRHRKGYRDKTSTTKNHEGTLAALVYGAESNPLEVRMEVGRGSPGDSNNYRVPVTVRIPMGRLTFLPQESQHRGSVVVSVGVLDGQGRISDVTQTPIPIMVPAERMATAQGQDFVYDVELVMRRGQQAVGVGVRDELAGQASFIRRWVNVGPGA